MPIQSENLEQNEAGLWEFGVVLPLKNVMMERFEQQAVLSRSVSVGATEIHLVGHSDRIKPNSRIYIGPSSDPTRDDSGDLVYKEKFEVFRVATVTAVADEDKIVLNRLEPGFQIAAENAYVVGDPVVFRPLAESWEYLAEDQFAGINTISDPRADTDFIFSREDSLDEKKDFSQGIETAVALVEPKDIGISQALSGAAASVMHRLKNKGIKISAWVRVQNFEGMSDTVDHGTVDPYIICSFYNNQIALKVNAIPSFTYLFGAGDITDRPWNVLVQDRVLVPPNPMSMRFGVYGSFQENPDEQPVRLLIDDAIVEHIGGTSQENNGRYKVDTNPVVSLSVNNKTSRQTAKDPTGKIRDLKVGDPKLRLEINAEWTNKPSYFINDMRQLENWNKEGFPIALRPKMPGHLPNVILCNIEVDVDYFYTAGNRRGNVKIKFSEVTI